MTRTKRRGWMKREWSKFPLGSHVRYRLKGDNHVLWDGTGAEGTIIGYGQAGQVPTLHIELTTPVTKGVVHYPIGTILRGQPLRWWEVRDG